MTPTIALYGGSFNPSTAAHRAFGLALLAQLPIDAVWYLVSPQNPFKPRDGMAPFADRVAMARLNLTGEPRLVVQTLEADYAHGEPDGAIATAKTLRFLRRDFPDTRFAWAMGADNFAQFHTWGADVESIWRNHPLIVAARDPFTAAALASPSARRIPRLAAADELPIRTGWLLIDALDNGINATACRKDLEAGFAPADMRPDVARYALDRRLYASSPGGPGG